jgi:hypothetical protein
MGKTWRRDENWSKTKERSFQTKKEREKAARRRFSEDDTDASFGETKDGFWENSGRPPR